MVTVQFLKKQHKDLSTRISRDVCEVLERKKKDYLKGPDQEYLKLGVKIQHSLALYVSVVKESRRKLNQFHQRQHAIFSRKRSLTEYCRLNVFAHF